MTLRLSEHGRKIFENWLQSATSADRELVARVLESVVDGTWKTPRWYYTRDVEDRHVIVIKPRDHLFVSIKFWHDGLPDEPDTFDLLSIIALPQQPAAGD